MRRSGEGVALGVSCASGATGSWLGEFSTELDLCGGQSKCGVMVGDCKDLLGSTGISFKAPQSRIVAGRDSGDVVGLGERRSKGVSTKGWRVVGGRRDERHQAVVLIVDEVSARELGSGDGGHFWGSTECRWGRWVDVHMAMLVLQMDLQLGRAASAVLSRRVAAGEVGVVLIREPWLRHGSVMGLSLQGCRLLVPSKPEPRVWVLPGDGHTRRRQQ